MIVFAWIAAAYRWTPSWAKMAVAAVVLLATVFLAGDIRGRRIEHAKCEAAAAAAKTAADTQDVQANNEVRDSELETINELKRQKGIDDKAIVDLEERLRSKSSTSCVYD